MNFIRNVIDLNIQYLWAATRRGIVPATSAFVLTVLGAGAVASMTVPTYLAEGKLLFKRDRAATLAGVENPNEGPLTTVSFGSVLNSEIQVITAKPLIQEVIDTLQLKDDEGEPLKVEDVLLNLQVNIVFQTDVLSFSYLDPDPVKAADVINTLMELYRSERLTSNQEDTENAGEFLDRQLPVNAEKVREAEYELRIFRETYNIIDLSQEQGTVVAALNDFRIELDTIQANLRAMYAVQANLSSELGLSVSEAIRSNTLSQSGQIQDILAELNAVRRQIAVQQVEFTEESPVLQRLRAQETSLTNLLNESVRTLGGTSVQESLLQVAGPEGSVRVSAADSASGESFLQTSSIRELLIEEYVTNQLGIISLEGQLEAVEANAQQYQNRVNLLPELEQRQRDLERNLQAAQETYQELLTRRQSLRVKENQLTNFIQIIEPAIPPAEPSSQVTTKILAMGAVAGFALAISIIVLIDFYIVDVKGTGKVYDPDTQDVPAGL
ncbi:capsular exopolysaccharide biosynthesis protein [Leptolyngbya sp. Heron Island J]|uniref:GumC family protein n=1 Tax=Leptolyngbya sp. Heron Island J TaxID=1385935 RepID=UPI0003B9BE48|nr:GumC family protein [Leptolyngbya sp. Heron Island J]ESA38875.1 capsular exopolysaccharide biosynthesis protein [Leptolyngbya sp. Heron Island J]